MLSTTERLQLVSHFFCWNSSQAFDDSWIVNAKIPAILKGSSKLWMLRSNPSFCMIRCQLGYLVPRSALLSVRSITRRTAAVFSCLCFRFTLRGLVVGVEVNLPSWPTKSTQPARTWSFFSMCPAIFFQVAWCSHSGGSSSSFAFGLPVTNKVALTFERTLIIS